jgi:hypothetical protein
MTGMSHLLVLPSSSRYTRLVVVVVVDRQFWPETLQMDSAFTKHETMTKSKEDQNL